MKSTCIIIILDILVFILISFSSCKKEEERIMMVSNDSISNIAHTTARAYATIIDPGKGIEQHGHCWSTSGEPTMYENENRTENGPANISDSYSSLMTDLLPGTKYYVRAYAEKSGTVVYGDVILSFRTLNLGSPVVSTGEVTDITATSANIGGNMESLGAGAYEVTQHGHCWSSETVTPVIEGNSNKTSLGSRTSTGPFESQMISLSLNTTYYVRAYATNTAGTSYGNQVSFKTSAQLAEVTTKSITAITFSSAVGGGEVTSDGGAPVTERGVCWSTAENPKVSDSHTTDGSGTGPFISEITGLLPLTNYYVRAYAINSAGISYGDNVSFTTLTDDPNVDWEPGDDWIDRRDDETYKTVKIGNQVWMAENLKAKYYSDSSALNDGTGAGDLTGQYSAKYWFYYNNDPGNEDIYGLLYTWAAVMNGAPGSDSNPSGVQGICPSGWHVPSDSEWKELEMYLGMSQAEADATDWRGTDEGTKLKSTIGWDSGGNGTNTSGFTALPAGFRYYDSNFGSLGIGTLFWNSTEYDSYQANGRLLLNAYDNIFRSNDFKGIGCSVRCVKNPE